MAYTTAFRWRHRFLSALNLDKPLCLSGIVEADETFILESFKGKRRDLPRASRKRGGKAAKRGLSAEQIPVIVARDRTGATIDAVLPRLDAASITARSGRSLPGQPNFAAMEVRRSPHSLGAPGSSSMSCPHPARPSRRRQISTSTTSTPITAG